MTIPLILAILLTSNPLDTSSIKVEQAGSALLRGLTASPRNTLLEALALDPENIEALLTLALLEQDLQNYAAARGYLQRALKLDPFNDDARVDLITVLWYQGNLAEASTVLQELTERHPNWETTLTLDKQLQAHPTPPARKEWVPVVEAGFATGYDTNITLKSSLVEISNKSSPLLNANLTLGMTSTKRQRPLEFYLEADTTTLAGAPDDLINDYLPTSIGLTGIGRAPLASWDLAFYVNYKEIFTSFTTYNQRLISPQLTIDTAILGDQTLRLLASSDLRFHNQTDITNDYTFQLGVRDTLHLRRGNIALQVTGRKNQGVPGTSDEAQELNALLADSVQFSEAATTIYTNFHLSSDISLFGIVDSRYRLFSLTDHYETSVSGQLGIRFNFDTFAVHVQYGYQNNTNSDSQSYRNFDRHQLFTGLRYWLSQD